MYFARTTLALMALLLCVSTINAQEKAFLVLCDSAPGQMIVLDGQGDWIPDVKSVSITISVDGKTEITTIAYSGVIRPTKPKTKSYELAQIKSVTKKQFVTIIDGLQDDSAFVKNSNTFNTTSRTNVQKPIENPATTNPLDTDNTDDQ